MAELNIALAVISETVFLANQLTDTIKTELNYNQTQFATQNKNNHLRTV